MKKYINFFMVLSFIVGLIGCKKDVIDEPTDTTTTITGKVNGNDFTPTSSNFFQNEMGGITMVISNSEIVISISTTDKVVGIYTITSTKSTNSNTATAIIYKNGEAFNASTGSIEINSISNDNITGTGTITANNGSNTMSVTGLVFENIQNTDLADELVGIYTGSKYIYVVEDTSWVPKEVFFKATISKNTTNNVNIKFVADNNEFSQVDYNDYILKSYLWQDYIKDPLDTTTFITVLHNVIKIGKFESINDTIRWRNLGYYENKVLNVSDYHCTKP